MSEKEQKEEESLSSTFKTAETLRDQIATGSQSSNDALPELIKLYTKAADLISRLALFSPNESLDDISSSELQYLLVDYFLADALFKQPSQGGPARKEVILQARLKWDYFLRRLDEYELLSKQDSKLFEQYTENREGFEVGGGLDAAGRRQVKINRFQVEKTLKNKLAQLREDPRMAARYNADDGGGDDDAIRELHLSHIALRVHETFQNLEFASLELQMLKMAPQSHPDSTHSSRNNVQDDRQRITNDRDGYSDRLDLAHNRTSLTDRHAPILDKSGKPLRPFTLLDKRTQLQDGVFRPDHSLPTMSIDEYLAEEKRRGGIIEGGGAQSGVRPQVDEDDYKLGDEETYKARRWDEFKEDNPRGSGNTINRG